MVDDDSRNQSFYDSLAEHFHLIFEDWDAAMRQQGQIIAKLLPPPERGPILDAACGIGTQSLPLAALGYAVEASDISPAAITRARKECAARGLGCTFRIDDMRTLATAPPSRYAAVLAMDNALPHLESNEEIIAALVAMRTRLLPAGRLIISIRDYEHLLKERPSCTPPRFYGDGERRRIVFQIWDWIDERRYRVHQYITRAVSQGWITHHFEGSYRAVTTEEIAQLARRAGFHLVEILAPQQSNFYQPIIVARRAQ
jgi:glycine/sarcosine N-methyltransferase